MKTMKKKLTKAQMRVQIAKDVIKQVKLGFLKPESMTYFTAYLPTVKGLMGADLRDTLRNTKNCRVCAIGAAFTAHVLRYNEVAIDEGDSLISDTRSLHVGDRKMRDTLSRYFPPLMLKKIEYAFELFDPDVSWKDKIPNDTNRLVAIMQNIIAHNGTFKPGGEA